MKITIETKETTIIIEENINDIFELLDIFKRCSIALTYQERSWNEAILNEADDINNIRSSQTIKK